MEHNGEQSDHNAPMNAIELEVLVEEANKHVVELQERSISLTQRYAIWESICEKVNAVCGYNKKNNQ